MALPGFCRDTIKVWRAPLKESRGTTVRDWPNKTDHDVAGCSFQPVSTGTGWGDSRQAVDVRAVLYLPPGADVAEGDRVEFDGATYSIEGAPLAVRSPTGAVTHITCDLVDFRG